VSPAASARARHVLITGASRGLGRALALAFASGGATIGVHFAHDAAAAGETAAAVRRAGAAVYMVQADFTARAAVEAVAEAVRGTRLPLEVLILSAGVAVNAPLTGTTEADWDRTIAVNYRAPVLLLNALEDCLRRGSHVLAVGSLVGIRGAAGLAAYAASKGALLGFVRDAAARMGGLGICVNGVVPGLLQTDMMRAVPQAQFDAMAAENVLGRANSCDDVARAVTLIASMGTVSGQVFSLDSRLHPDGRLTAEKGT